VKTPLQARATVAARGGSAPSSASFRRSAAPFVDNRPAAAAQAKIKQIVGNDSPMRQYKTRADMMDNSLRTPARKEQDLAAAPVQRKPAPTSGMTGLPDQLKAGVESLSGMSMDHVQVHYNSPQPAQLNAHAYAQGGEIHVAPGQEQHLPHEAWHVVQQAQGRVKPTAQMKSRRPLIPPGAAIQRRVSNPAGLDTAMPEVQAGARRALIETLMDIRRTEADGPTWIDNTLNLAGDRGAMSALVNALSVDDLMQKINLVRTKYPNEGFDSTHFDVKPADNTDEDGYIKTLLAATVTKMLIAKNDNAALLNVFGDGDVASQPSLTAAQTAKQKIDAAQIKLNTFRNIFIDTSGIAKRVGIGGYANFDRKIFLLVKDNINAAPSTEAITTLFHETMHVTHAEILDAGGYSSSGAAFRGRSIQAKLTNADHYAEIARIIDGTSGHPVPFTPVVPGAVAAAVTNPADTPATMAVRSNVQDRGRLLWSGAADLFMKSVRNKRSSTNTGSTDASKKLHMTYHHAPWYRWPDLNDVDLSLAEGSVNRIARFTGALGAFVRGAADDTFTYINTRYLAAAGANTVKEKNAGKQVLVDKGIASDILTPEDKLPSVAERFNDMSRSE